VRRYFGIVLLASSSLWALGCGSTEPENAGTDTAARDLQLDPDYQPDNPLVQAQPASDYTLFEADPVRPIAVLPSSGLVAVANTADDFLDLARPTERGVQTCGAIKVGMRPVAVALVRESRTDAELWVVNHLSDSVSIVHVDPTQCTGEVSETLFTGDEPRDIVVTKNGGGQQRVFVTSAHRGQHHPIASARSGADLVLGAQSKQNQGLADVLVFDPRAPTATPKVVNLFTDTPRALAVGDGVVYAAGFKTGNRTTAVHGERAAQRGVDRLAQLLKKDASGAFIEQSGELVLAPGVRGVARMAGGMPAVVGSGRCTPDPRPELAERFLQQVCVETDRQQRVRRVSVQHEGTVDATCQCTSGSGALQPATAVIVKFFDRPRDCGQDFTTFPDGTRGCWLDADPAGVSTPAAHSGAQPPPMAWNDDVKLSLPDQDVFAIGVDDLRVHRAFSGVGTVLFGMAVQPGSGDLFVTNTEAQNLTHFEGEGGSSSTTVLGHLHESRVTVIDPRLGRVRPVHLNSHIDYSRCCARQPGENENSFAFPTAGTFSPDGDKFYFTALGSDKLGIVRARDLAPGFDNPRARRRHELSDVTFGPSVELPAGPVGLELDAARRRLYVKTHISNELVVVDTDSERITGRVALHTPEPDSILKGRRVFYNARLTSSHGDSACASCHVFGDFDGLSWDLGNPDAATVTNPGPFAVPTELAALGGIAVDPLGDSIVNRPRDPNFRSNKGPMNTQTLRGMANHGAEHWRGDRTRNFQDEPGRQPNFGSLDENNSFGEFDVAIPGLNGNDAPLDPAVFQSFTDFALQLTLPPNPIRSLDDSLDAAQTRARARYFGCQSMSDDQFESRECIGLDGSLVGLESETHACTCANNPLIGILHQAPQAQALGRLLQGVLSDSGVRDAFLTEAADTTGLAPADAARLPALVANLSASIDGLIAADLALGAKGLFSADAAAALAKHTGGTLAIVELPRALGQSSQLFDVLFAALPSGTPFTSPEALDAAFRSTFPLANLAFRTALDEAASGTGAFHNMLTGCDPSQPVPECRLGATDSFQTCHGCHTLDRAGNAEFDVYRPGFFGTSGEYSFENESQVLKVPHLRNMYQKVGMFGTSRVEFFFEESVLGPRKGGFFAPDFRYQGPQVRGFGFTHDGSGDTLERFHGAAVFVERAPLTLGNSDPGNPEGFDAVFPLAAQRPACVAKFRAGSPDVLGTLDPTLRSALALCSSASPLPDVCFLDPSAAACQQVLQALGAAVDQPEFPATFVKQILPACFQFGSMLEGGSPDGVCAPSGLRERSDMESFMLAFDSNLKPMVGQQLTLHGSAGNAAFLRQLLHSAQLGQCDLALRQGNQGYLVTLPDADRSERSGLQRANGRSTTLGTLRRDADPITLTCYPPAPDQAEARRSAFDPRMPPRPVH
jgi:DNA-binding beta-propeller fold protein YncE